MTTYDVTYVHPTRGQVTARQAYITQLREVNGEVLFMYNDHYNSCKVLECVPVQEITVQHVTMNGRFSCE